MPTKTKPSVDTAADASRMLGQVRMSGKKAAGTAADLERNIIRAHRAGASMRDIAREAGFASHHKVQEILARHST